MPLEIRAVVVDPSLPDRLAIHGSGGGRGGSWFT